MNKNKKIKEILKLLALFIIVILLIIISTSASKKTKNKKINYETPSKKNTKTEKKKTEDLFPKIEDDSERDILINSKEAEKIKNGTLRKKDLGPVEAEIDGYKNIFSQGIEIKEAMGKIIAAKFSEKYNAPVIGGIYPGADEKEIVKKIGNPNVKYEKIYLYILDGIDVAFNIEEKTINVYKNKEADKNKYYNILEKYKEFLKDKDLKKMVTDITKENPVYYRYDYDNDYVVLDYFDLGARIKFTKDGKTNGLYLFNNFIKSENYEQKDIDELSKKNEIYLEKRRLSLTEELYREGERKIREKRAIEIKDILNAEINGEKGGYIPEDVEVYYEESSRETNFGFRNVIIKSKTNKFPKHKLNVSGNADIVIFDNNIIIYILDNDGIYTTNIDGTNTKKIYNKEDSKNHIILEYYNFDTKTIYFNGKTLNINN